MGNGREQLQTGKRPHTTAAATAANRLPHFLLSIVPRAEIEADDARLALKYPGMWQRRPESMEYAAVSVVGFNPAKTKAMVYVRLRSSGRVQSMERREGGWV